VDKLILDDVTLAPWECETNRGITLRGYETEPRGKPVLHFIHGNGFNGLVYWPLLKNFLPYVDIILSNAQGHGESDAGKHFLGWKANASLLAEALTERLKTRQGLPVIGMGHSFGGGLTTFMAAARPGLFSRLVLLDPIYLPKTYSTASSVLYKLGVMQHVPMVKQARNRRSSWQSREQAWDTFYQRGVFKGWHDECLNAYIDFALQTEADGLQLKTPPWLEAEVFARYPLGIWKAISKLSMPVRILYGNETYPFVHRGVHRAAARNDVISVEEFPGDHCFMQQCPYQVAEKVLPYMKVNIKEN